MLPNTIVFTILVIAFQITIAIMIFTRGDIVTVALLAGAGFALLAALASNPGGTIGNLVLAAIHLLLAFARAAYPPTAHNEASLRVSGPAESRRLGWS